ncbi:MAG: helix-turn-helix domain-containing protein [Spirochaetales bacterium]|nr:helix-turn-helix domain-containing protein [Spirochaetales bacterium]
MSIFNYITPITNISFVLSIVFFFFALGQLMKKGSERSHFFLFVVFLSMAIQCISLWLYFRDSPFFEKYLYYSDSAFLYLVGPFVYLFFLDITAHIDISSKKIGLHSLPFAMSLVFFGIFNSLVPTLDEKKSSSPAELVIYLSYLSLAYYMARILRMLRAYYADEKQSREVKWLSHIALCAIVLSFCLLLTPLWKGFQYISHAASLGVSLSLIVFLIRYPDFFNRAQEESEEIKYLNSRLGNIDKKKIVARLDELMRQEKVYRNGRLSLKELSTLLSISPSQLSELLNSHYDASFNNFVNSYRVEELKSIFQTKADVNILQAAIDCGFNSKSTFNTVFRKQTGLTPTQFRQKTRSES